MRLIFTAVLLMSLVDTLAQAQTPIILQDKSIKTIEIHESFKGNNELSALIHFNKKGWIKEIKHGNYHTIYHFKRNQLAYISARYHHPKDSSNNFSYKKFYIRKDSTVIIDSTIMYRLNGTDTIVRQYHPSVMARIPYVSTYFMLTNSELKQMLMVEQEGLYDVRLDSAGILKSTSFEGETFTSGCVIWTESTQTFYNFNSKKLLTSLTSKTSGRIVYSRQYQYNEQGLPISWKEKEAKLTEKQFVVNYTFY